MSKKGERKRGGSGSGNGERTSLQSVVAKATLSRLAFSLLPPQEHRERLLCDRERAKREKQGAIGRVKRKKEVNGVDEKKPSMALSLFFSLTFCSSACSAVSACLPPPPAPPSVADAPAGGPEPTVGGGGGPAPEGGCCIVDGRSGSRSEEMRRRQAKRASEPASSLSFLSVLSPSALGPE